MITFSGVSKQFGDSTKAINNVSFAIEPGELVLLTGHSGSGKTTIMRLMTKEYQPTEGEIEFNGQSLNQLPYSQVHQHRRQVGVVFQDFKLLPELTVWENIALPLHITRKSTEEVESRVTDLLKLIELVDHAYVFPSQLSGGEAQRVSIARALATAPKVIFADEPTGNLDPDTTQAIGKLFKTINSLGTTILIATHDLGLVSSFSKPRHIVLEKGSIISDTGAKAHAVHKSKPSHEVTPVESTGKRSTPKPSIENYEPEKELPEIAHTTVEGNSKSQPAKSEQKKSGGWWHSWFGKKASKDDAPLSSDEDEKIEIVHDTSSKDSPAKKMSSKLSEDSADESSKHSTKESKPEVKKAKGDS